MTPPPVDYRERGVEPVWAVAISPQIREIGIAKNSLSDILGTYFILFKFFLGPQNFWTISEGHHDVGVLIMGKDGPNHTINTSIKVA